MNSTKLLGQSLLHALGVVAYISGIVWLMNNLQQTAFEEGPWTPVLFLMMFVLSATIVGLLVLGRPVLMFLNGAKADALRLLFYTIGWLIIFTVVVFSIFAF